jgi:hypothetical protein
MEPIFYYIKGHRFKYDKRKGRMLHIIHPVITVCLVKVKEDVYVRGVAICSAKDNPCKKEGRNQALKVALEMKDLPHTEFYPTTIGFFLNPIMKDSGYVKEAFHKYGISSKSFKFAFKQGILKKENLFDSELKLIERIESKMNKEKEEKEI